jgi:hypothetical protein
MSIEMTEWLELVLPIYCVNIILFYDSSRIYGGNINL